MERFGTTPWRRQLLEGLARALRDLRAAGCKRAYIDGNPKGIIVIDLEDFQ